MAFRISLGLVLVTGAALAAPKPTFYKDVQPVLERNCVGCHRPGEAAPMSLLNYKQVRPYAAAIKASVSQRRMPPWQADPHVGKFSNDRSLSVADIATLSEWASTGAAEGDAKDAQPVNRDFAEGWTIGKPDVVIEMPETFTVPARGTVEYHYVVLPSGFTKDTWIEAAETRPLSRAVNHHIIAFVREPGSKWFRDALPGKVFIPSKDGNGMTGEFLTGYAPGTVPDQLRPGQAKLIKAGSDIVLQLHWTANGKETVDKAKLGLIIAKSQPKERVLTLQSANFRFEIPPGADNHAVEGKMTLHAETVLEALVPHMHVRGKAFSMSVKLPDGTVKPLLKVPAYDFNWQLTYKLQEPMRLPAGSQILATGWFDNSPNNKNNPDPTKTVRFGEQSWEEMMIGFFNVSVPMSTSFADIVRPKKPAAPASSAGGLD
jgi:hypothetical protein